MFLSVSFLFSSSFRSMPTIPTARVLPACRNTKDGKKIIHPSCSHVQKTHALPSQRTICTNKTLFQKNNKGRGRKRVRLALISPCPNYETAWCKESLSNNHITGLVEQLQEYHTEEICIYLTVLKQCHLEVELKTDMIFFKS